MPMKPKLVSSLLVFVIIFLFAASVVQSSGNRELRVIAHSDKEVKDAELKGCKKVREARTLKALVCQEDVAASLGLQEDVKVFALGFEDKEIKNNKFTVGAADANANNQIRANLVQSSGNTGSGRKVVVLDTGYNYNHPELSSSYLGGKDFVNNDNDPFDDNGHGSHVSGIITGDGIISNAKGVAPSTGIIAEKVLDSSGSGYFSDVVAGIYWAIDGNDGIFNTSDDINADAISLSLGTSQPYTYKGFCDNVLPDLTNAISYAKSKNVLVVVAAGNSRNAGVSIPGCISHSTTVGAVDSKDKIASFSGRGNAVDISAPGVSILSAWLKNSYVIASGTSMATPMISGTIALIKNAHPTYNSAQIENSLFKTAKDLGQAGKDTSFGWGRVDSYSAVNYIS